ncbi:MAG: radical SAM protein [Deltaproteobacteria bacterium]|nr:radical SAM protein [Deltaproteobacteria bacterium]
MTASAPLPPPQPDRQIEVQLGHLCNNRCVFCVSGQLSEQRRAPQLPLQPILHQIAQARANGAQRVTLLGGEPTIQRGFLDVLRFCVDLQFDEVVVFTNGVMTPRETFRLRVFDVLDQLGPEADRRVLWRFSLQGGNRAEHDATTKNEGAWDRIVGSLDVLRQRGARLTANMCVVESNYRSVPELAAIAAHYAFENLHLDMVRPRDSGDRSDAELRAMMARYTDMAPYFVELSRLVDERLGAHWDLNFGNVPYCTNLAVAHRIHHDGQDTVTVAADGQGNTQLGFDKYLDKRTDKHKPAGCAQCIFNDTCSGVFDKYRQFHGDDEFQPVGVEALWHADALGRHFVRLAHPALLALQAGGALRLGRSDERRGVIEITAQGWRLAVHGAGREDAPGTFATLRGQRIAAGVLHAPAPSAQAERDGLYLWRRLSAALADPGDPPVSLRPIRDAWRQWHQSRLADGLAGSVATVLRREALAGFAAESQSSPLPGRIDVAFRNPAGRGVVLHVAVAADASGQLRTRLGHDRGDATQAELAAFSRALGGQLRALPAALRQTLASQVPAD